MLLFQVQHEGASAEYFAQLENLEALKTRIIVQVAQPTITSLVWLSNSILPVKNCA